MARKPVVPRTPEDVIRSIRRNGSAFTYVGREHCKSGNVPYSVVRVRKVPKGVIPFSIADNRILIGIGLGATAAFSFVMDNPTPKEEEERLIFTGARWKSQTGHEWVLVALAREGRRVLELEDYLSLFFMSDNLTEHDHIVATLAD